jgi:hypothetical protein
LDARQISKLIDAIKVVTDRLGKFRGRALGEENTKASLIDPVIEALGWDTRDPDEVYREFKPTPKDCPVDYALTLHGTPRLPRLLVEAKGYGESLADRRWIGQILGYATVAGVVWCVLTDGDEYRFYNATAAVDAEEKIFCRIKLSEAPPEEAARTLSLISRSNMEENFLDLLWKSHFVDRRVKAALTDALSVPDKGTVRLVRKRVPELGPKEIVESLRRLDIRIEMASALPDQFPAPRAAALSKRRPAKRTPVKKGKAHYGVRLSEVIAAGFLSPPLTLFRKYMGKRMEATLLPDGGVEYDGTRYNTCSTAAEVARSTITGRRMNTNGWIFWQYTDSSGKVMTLEYARARHLAQKQGMPPAAP